MDSVRNLLALITAAAVAVGVAGCGDDPAPDPGNRLSVVVGFYPLQFVADRVGGDRVAVTDLVRPGVEPHDLELSAGQVGALEKADLVLYLTGFQPALDEAVGAASKDKAFDVATVEPLNDAPAGDDEPAAKDPHVWLDPVRLATIADRVADRLATLDAEHAAAIRDRAALLRSQLTALDREYASGLATCQRREIVTSHTAFGYLAARYRLTQVPISGLAPDAEPSPQRLAEVAALAKQTGTTTIFFETLVSPKLAETLAAEVGAKTEVLDPIEGLQPGSSADYLSVMRDNLGKLRTALGCT